jgi:hypothetical protein
LQRNTNSFTEQIIELRQQNDRLQKQLSKYFNAIAHGMVMSHRILTRTVMLESGSAENLDIQLRNSILNQHKTQILDNLVPDAELLEKLNYSVLTKSEKERIQTDTDKGKIKRILIIVDEGLDLGHYSEKLFNFIQALLQCTIQSTNKQLGKILDNAYSERL